MASSKLNITAAAGAILAVIGGAQAGQTGQPTPHYQPPAPPPAPIKQTGLQTTLNLNNTGAQLSFENAAGFLAGQPVFQAIQQSVGTVNQSSLLATGLNSAGPGNGTPAAPGTGGPVHSGAPIVQNGLQTGLNINDSAAQLSFENAAGFLKGQPVRQTIQQSVGTVNSSSYLATGLNSTGPGF